MRAGELEDSEVGPGKRVRGALQPEYARKEVLPDECNKDKSSAFP